MGNINIQGSGGKIGWRENGVDKKRVQTCTNSKSKEQIFFKGAGKMAPPVPPLKRNPVWCIDHSHPYNDCHAYFPSCVCLFPVVRLSIFDYKYRVVLPVAVVQVASSSSLTAAYNKPHNMTFRYISHVLLLQRNVQ